MATPRSFPATLISASSLSSHEKSHTSKDSVVPKITCDNSLPHINGDATHPLNLTLPALGPCAKQSPQLESPLLSKLPRELRDQIWREIVVEDLEIPIHVAHYETKEGEHRRRLQIEHNLQLVCKQTRDEVSDIYYHENTFRITDDLFSERAVRELHRFLRPWAAKMTQLEISHEFVRSEGNTADINFAVELSEGKIAIKPHTFTAHLSTLRGDQTGRMAWQSTFKEMCYCKILKIAWDHDGDGGTVLDWLKRYVDMIVLNQAESKYYVPYCWTCACNVII